VRVDVGAVELASSGRWRCVARRRGRRDASEKRGASGTGAARREAVTKTEEERRSGDFGENGLVPIWKATGLI
jgi:hypothetical protein